MSKNTQENKRNHRKMYIKKMKLSSTVQNMLQHIEAIKSVAFSLHFA